MECQEHPKYAGKRKPRTECKGCWAVYNHNQEAKLAPEKPAKAVTSEKKKTAPPKKATSKEKKKEPKQSKPRVKKEKIRNPIDIEFRDTHIEGVMPDRLLSVSPARFRSEMLWVLKKFFPDYIVSATSDACHIVLEDRVRHLYGTNLYRVEGGLMSVSPAKHKEDLLEKSKRVEKDLQRGEIYYSEKLSIPIIVISFNEKDKIVYFRDWYTKELLSMSEKEFSKLELRDIIAEDDFEAKLPLKAKVLSYW
jgi:hypothetical protein